MFYAGCKDYDPQWLVRMFLLYFFWHTGVVMQSLSADTQHLMKVRRWAQRKRMQQACQGCKTRKIKCSAFRPCARCLASREDMSCGPDTRAGKVWAWISRFARLLYLTLDAQEPTPMLNFTKWTPNSSRLATNTLSGDGCLGRTSPSPGQVAEWHHF